METFPASSAIGRVDGLVVGAASAGAAIDKPRSTKISRIIISYRHHSTCQSLAAAAQNLWSGGWGRFRGRGGRDNNLESAMLLLIKCNPKKPPGDHRQKTGAAIAPLQTKSGNWRGN